MKASKITKIAIFAIVAAMISFLENFLSPLIPVPGMKLGFSNIVLLVGLLYFDKKDVFGIAVLKSVLAGLLGGSITSILYSLPSGLAAVLGMDLMNTWKPKVSNIGPSVVGALLFNFVQVLVSYFVLSSFIYFYYLPYIVLVGTFTGALNGYIVNQLSSKNTLGVVLK